MEERKGDAHDLLEKMLNPPQVGAPGVLHLIKEIVLPKGKGRDQGGSAGSQNQ